MVQVIYNEELCEIFSQNGQYVTLKTLEGKFYLSIHIKLLTHVKTEGTNGGPHMHERAPGN